MLIGHLQIKLLHRLDAVTRPFANDVHRMMQHQLSRSGRSKILKCFRPWLQMGAFDDTVQHQSTSEKRHSSHSVLFLQCNHTPHSRSHITVWVLQQDMLTPRHGLVNDVVFREVERRTRNRAASAPLITRWSNDIERGKINRSVQTPSTKTGWLRARAIPRIATSG